SSPTLTWKSYWMRGFWPSTGAVVVLGAPGNDTEKPRSGDWNSVHCSSCGAAAGASSARAGSTVVASSAKPNVALRIDIPQALLIAVRRIGILADPAAGFTQACRRPPNPGARISAP